MLNREIVYQGLLASIINAKNNTLPQLNRPFGINELNTPITNAGRIFSGALIYFLEVANKARYPLDQSGSLDPAIIGAFIGGNLGIVTGSLHYLKVKREIEKEIIPSQLKKPINRTGRYMAMLGLLMLHSGIGAMSGYLIGTMLIN